MTAQREYPIWICRPCGEKHGARPVGVATWHTDTCGICGERTSCTEPRDFGHLPAWDKQPEYVNDAPAWVLDPFTLGRRKTGSDV